MKNLEDYKQIVGDEVIWTIRQKARKLYGKHIVHINSTYQGGGVAEMLGTLVPLMNDIGIDAGWRILHGTTDFFNITKKFHNALQGDRINLSEMKKRLYLQANESFSTYTHIEHDCVIIHDPQPLPLVRYYRRRQPWIWRCHIDLSHPDENLWQFLKTFILRYDMVLLSSDKYRQEDLPVEQRIVHPVIDPLSPKNIPLNNSEIIRFLKKFKIPLDKPIISQISRFDKWKDPEGVVKVFEKVKKEVDCRLILCGSMAFDDPEGWKIYERVKRRVSHHLERNDVILITSEDTMLVNALQRAAAVVIQKSLKEGFGLTVAEALWKEKPVVASNVGGISLQIDDGKTGFLIDPHDIDGCAERIIQLLRNPDLGHEMGKKGKEEVKNKYLITRILSDYLDLLNLLLT